MKSSAIPTRGTSPVTRVPSNAANCGCMRSIWTKARSSKSPTIGSLPRGPPSDVAQQLRHCRFDQLFVLRCEWNGAVGRSCCIDPSGQGRRAAMGLGRSGPLGGLVARSGGARLQLDEQLFGGLDGPEDPLGL